MSARRKSVEPACRVCGCTESRACEGGCWWAEVAKGEAPLCSACVGSADDMVEVLIRIKAMNGLTRLPGAVTIIKAAITRRLSRLRPTTGPKIARAPQRRGVSR
jgi:hypothetical protein